MKEKNNIWKLTLIPTCLIMIICGVLVLNKNDNIILKPSDPIIDKKQNYVIYINSIENLKNGLTKFDADIRTENYYMIPAFDFLTNLNIPNDFDNNSNFKAIYVKSDINSANYDVLNNYELWCRNTNNNRKIVIAFSDEYQPLRDYFFDSKNAKMSTINNTEIIIYQYENSYMTTFTYNNVNFDIETTDITQNEFINLLTSIIK